jgi:apolipoprotein N-acyltransferase
MPSFNSRPSRAAGALLSGCLLALAGSLHPIWGAAWVASVPVLVAAFWSTRRTAWGLGLVAGSIGGVSVLGYYATVATLPVALLITALKALIYAGGVRLAWSTRGRLPPGIAVFAFPAWFAAFDVLIATYSPNGTAGSPAYSQMSLPVAFQVASLGGAPAVTFVVYLFSSALAHAIVPADSSKRTLAAAAPAWLIVALALGFGAWRISTAPTDPTIAVAVSALDQQSELPDNWRASVEVYRPLLARARAGHASLVVLPEEIAVASAEDLQLIQADLGGFARDSEAVLAV